MVSFCWLRGAACFLELDGRITVRAVKVFVPVLNAVNPIVVSVFGSAADEQSIADDVLILVARPAVAGFADRDLVPLSALVEPAHGGEFRPVPYAFHSVLENVAHVVFVEAI